MDVVSMPELQDIFNHVRLDSMSPAQAKAFNMIRHCRTATLGYHAEVCTECGSVEVSYNSCRNRHCPKCQHAVQEEWVEAQMSKLLPVGYFHVVFTIPQELNTLTFQNQRLLYSILIQSAGHTLIELAKDPKYLGATTGVLRFCIPGGRIYHFILMSIVLFRAAAFPMTDFDLSVPVKSSLSRLR